MRWGAVGSILAGSLVLIAQGALGASLSISLKNFYAEYEVVKQCHEQSQLSPADAESAKGAIAKIEAYYLERDASINKERVLKQAVADKNDGFRIATRNNGSDLKYYCRVSLKELLTKAEEIGGSAKSQ